MVSVICLIVHAEHDEPWYLCSRCRRITQWLYRYLSTDIDMLFWTRNGNIAAACIHAMACLLHCYHHVAYCIWYHVCVYIYIYIYISIFQIYIHTHYFSPQGSPSASATPRGTCPTTRTTSRSSTARRRRVLFDITIRPDLLGFDRTWQHYWHDAMWHGVCCRGLWLRSWSWCAMAWHVTARHDETGLMLFRDPIMMPLCTAVRVWSVAQGGLGRLTRYGDLCEDGARREAWGNGARPERSAVRRGARRGAEWLYTSSDL